MAGDDARLGVNVQGVADDTAPIGIARERGDLTVGRDSAAGDFSDDVVDQFKGVFHRVHPLFKIVLFYHESENMATKNAAEQEIILLGGVDYNY